MRKLIIASNNEGKCKEIKAILTDLPFSILSLKDIGVTIHVVEDQDTFEGNALKKALETMRTTGEIALADDSGLEVEVLHGQPGVYSAMFAGVGATDLQNSMKLLELIKDAPYEQRKASFCCVIAIAYPDGSYIYAKERLYGMISFCLAGENGFGYDPLFIPDGFDKTFAQLDKDVKNQISHRALALRKIKHMLKEQINEG